MANSMKLFLELGARTVGFVREMGKANGSVAGFARSARRELAGLKSAFGGVRGQLAAMGLGLSAGKVISDSAQLSKSLIRIKQTAGGTVDQIKTLRNDLFGMGRESGQGIENLKDGFNDLVQASLDMDQATGALRGMNIAMAVTGATAKTLAGGLTVGAEQFKIDLSKPGKALELLDKMTVAGRKGNAELEDLSAIFSGVGANASLAGMGFEKTLAFIEGLSMVEKQPDKLKTLADSTLRVFTNLRYMKEAQNASKVKFFDDDGSRRDTMSVLSDIKKKYATLTTDAQRAKFVEYAFGKSDQDTIKGMITLLKGDALIRLAEIQKAIEEAGGTLKRDFYEAVDNLPDQINMLKNDLRSAADSFVQPLNRGLTDAIKKIRASKADGGYGMDGKDMMLWGSALLTGGVVAGHVLPKAMKGLAGKFFNAGSSTAAGIATGKAIEKMTGVAPVYVTNWPDGGFGGSLPGGGSGGVAAGGLKTAAKWASGGIGAFGAGLWIGEWVNKLIEKQIEKSSGGKYSGPGALGDKVYDLMHELPGEIKNVINLVLNVDESGRTFSSSDDPNTIIKPVLNRGNFRAGK